MNFERVARKDEFEPGKAVLVSFEGEDVAIFLVEGTYFAICDTCPHRDGPLHEGLVEGKSVTCPWHFGKFDLETGEAIEPPPTKGVRTYEVRVTGEDIELRKA